MDKTETDTVDAGLAATFAPQGDNAKTLVSDGFDATIDVASTSPFARTMAAASATGAATLPVQRIAATTVLPRVDPAGTDEQGNPSLHASGLARYEHVKALGAGGMGEVDLAKDNDIGRKVAVKRLLPEATHGAGLARFVDEIRTIGRLEHPNIVPIHDVGIDDQGRYFFVMKYVDGQTLESIIEKLDAGDPATLKKYTFEVRTQLFMGLLRALEYAHANGIVHRDLKPANVMVGPYGEVILMDWGIAKSVRDRSEAAVAVPAGDEKSEAKIEAKTDAKTDVAGDRARLFTTRHGSLVGTPAYMSPEQAAGHNDKIDERSDIYSACVLFHELLYLKHYLSDQTNLTAMLYSVLHHELSFITLGSQRHQHQPPVPGELIHFVRKGLRKNPADRWQSVGEMVESLQGIAEGRVRIQCHVTLTKRIVRELGRFVDRHPNVSFGILVTLFGGICAGGYELIRIL